MSSESDEQEIDTLSRLAMELYAIGVFKFGEFGTRIGIASPIYIDLKLLSGYPQLLDQVAHELSELIDDTTPYDQVCGVPYIGLMLGSSIGAERGLPMVVRRLEQPAYGIRKKVEGVYHAGMKVLMVNDIVTSGTTIIETALDLAEEGLRVNTVLVVVDREQGAHENLEELGIELKSLFVMSELMAYLEEEGIVSKNTVHKVMAYVDRAPTNLLTSQTQRLVTDFGTRAAASRNPVAARLLGLMAEKRTTICLAADLTRTHDLLALADIIGPHIVIFKLHSDIIEDFDEDFIENLRVIANRHRFLIMEDRKFADKGSVISQQCRRGKYRIAEWADLITVHSMVGPCVIDDLRTCLNTIKEPRGIFIVAELSTDGAFTNGEYVSFAIQMGKDNNLIAGYMCRKNVFDDLGMIQLTPEVKFVDSDKEMCPSYGTLSDIVHAGADIVVVGRGIIGKRPRLEAALEYKRILFNCYEKRVNKL